MTHCNGCDQDQEGVKPYLARFIGADEEEPVEYCDGCAELARMNWNGCTESIREPGATIEDLIAVHGPEYVDHVEALP